VRNICGRDGTNGVVGGSRRAAFSRRFDIRIPLNGGQLNLTWKRRIQQIRQRWWVVAVVGVLAMSVVVAPAVLARPTYVGKTTLTVPGLSSTEGVPVIIGYMTIFNDPATINRLTATTKFPKGIKFEARTVAASPILSIEATANSPEVAQDAAQGMAEAFRADLNSVKEQGTADYIAELQGKLAGVAQFAPDGTVNPYFASLSNRIDDARNSLSGSLQVLQFRAGVAKHAPKISSTLVRGAAVGLVLGILAALALAAWSTRLTNSADLRDKTGIEPLVEMPKSGSIERNSVRRDRLRTLATLVSLQSLPKSTVIALTDSRGGWGARDIAEGLAELSAQQGRRTVLVYADNDPSDDPSDSAGSAGFNDALVHSSHVHGMLKDGDVESLKILPAGSTSADRYPLMARERIVAVLDELRTGADTIVVAAPSIAENAETQLVCAAADVTILVVTKGSRAGDVTSAAETLGRLDAHLLGAVFIDSSGGKRRGRPSAGSQHARPRINTDDTVSSSSTDDSLSSSASASGPGK
jgi:succinoglycan biosynthesis transport protein ExoP